MRITLQRIILGMTAVIGLSGCASNCNILSGNNSLGCDAMLVGGMILGAPILAPAALFSDAASDAKAKRMAQDWKASMEEGLANNDIEAIQECLQECDEAWKYQIAYSVRRPIQTDAAKRFIATDWPQLTSADHQVYMLLAHYVLSWQPDPARTQNGPRYALVPKEVTRSYALLKNKATRKQLKDVSAPTRYRKITSDIYGMIFAIDTPADDLAARAQFSNCPDVMSKIILDEDRVSIRTIACSRAYSYRFKESLPEELRQQWWANQKKNAT